MTTAPRRPSEERSLKVGRIDASRIPAGLPSDLQTLADTGSPRRSSGLCGAGCSACVQTRKNPPPLAYVGEGRGSYQPHRSYQYVGTGVGDHEMRPGETPQQGCCNRGCCFLVPLIMLLPFIGLLGYWLVVADKKKYDCTAGYDDWKEGWSGAKKEWCCNYRGKACQEDVVTSAPYDCNSGFARWRVGWSRSKKDYCCQHKGSGCDGVTTAPNYDCHSQLDNFETAWSDGKKSWCCQRVTCRKRQSFDCDKDFEHWHQLWDNPKRDYCCQHQNRGCESHHNRHRVQRTASEEFDCSVAFNNWKAAWSAGKKTWCCDHFKRGCAEASSCDAGCVYEGKSLRCAVRYERLAKNMFKGKLGSCAKAAAMVFGTCPQCKSCSVAESGCLEAIGANGKPTTTIHRYDCQAGASNWVRGWSLGKKTYCCGHGLHGCSTTPIVDSYDCLADASQWETKWSKGKKLWCCKHGNGGCEPSSTSIPFDCLDKLDTWKTDWRLEKKRWCCKNRGKGCGNDGRHNCQNGRSNWRHSWDEHKKEWCCRHEGHGCPAPASSIPYDCLAGYRKWQTGWSEEKREWCCKHRARGCSADENAD